VGRHAGAGVDGGGELGGGAGVLGGAWLGVGVCTGVGVALLVFFGLGGGGTYGAWPLEGAFPSTLAAGGKVSEG